MGSRYGLAGGYEDDPIWTRAEPRGYEVARPQNTMGPMAYQPSYQPSPTNIPQHTTIVHSAIKPVPDADIYIRFIFFKYRKCHQNLEYIPCVIAVSLPTFNFLRQNMIFSQA